MKPYRILIVEDEVLIADTIARYLLRRGYDVVGQAMSYDQAMELFLSEKPDLVLLDIRISGKRTGIEFAQYLQKQDEATPYIFLTSQVDSRSIQKAKATFPAGYLSKPIQRNSLYTTIEIAMHNYQAQQEEKEMVRLYNGKQYYQVPVSDILYLRADHNYIHIELVNDKAVLQRSSLRETMGQLPNGLFVRTHRSYAVNLERVSGWDGAYLYVEEDAIPVSRGRRREVQKLIERQIRIN